jgi:hypothetical protein
VYTIRDSLYILLAGGSELGTRGVAYRYRKFHSCCLKSCRASCPVVLAFGNLLSVFVADIGLVHR